MFLIVNVFSKYCSSSNARINKGTEFIVSSVCQDFKKTAAFRANVHRQTIYTKCPLKFQVF